MSEDMKEKIPNAETLEALRELREEDGIGEVRVYGNSGKTDPKHNEMMLHQVLNVNKPKEHTKTSLYHSLSKVVLEDVVELRYQTATLFSRIQILEDMLTDTLKKIRKDISRDGLSKKELNMYKNKIKRDLNKLKAEYDTAKKSLNEKQKILSAAIGNGNLPELRVED